VRVFAECGVLQTMETKSEFIRKFSLGAGLHGQIDAAPRPVQGFNQTHFSENALDWTALPCIVSNYAPGRTA
jgi:hypothetical protein